MTDLGEISARKFHHGGSNHKKHGGMGHKEVHEGMGHKEVHGGMGHKEVHGGADHEKPGAPGSVGGSLTEIAVPVVLVGANTLLKKRKSKKTRGGMSCKPKKSKKSKKSKGGSKCMCKKSRKSTKKVRFSRK